MTWTAWTREQRLSIVALALVLSAVPLTGMLAWIVGIIGYSWTGYDELRIAVLARVALYLTVLLFVVQLALSMVLSIRAFKATAGKDGATVDVQSNDGGQTVQATVSNSHGDTATASVPVAPLGEA